MSVIGPSGDEDMMDIVEDIRAEGRGNDSFSGKFLVHEGRNGDTYNCNVSNEVSIRSNGSSLKGVLFDQRVFLR